MTTKDIKRKLYKYEKTQENNINAQSCNVLTSCIESSIIPTKPKGFKHDAIDGVLPHHEEMVNVRSSCTNSMITLQYSTHTQIIISRSLIPKNQ